MNETFNETNISLKLSILPSKIGNFIWVKIAEYCYWVKEKNATGSNKGKFFSLCWHASFMESSIIGHWNMHFQTRRDELRVLIQCLRQFILCFLAYKELQVSYCFLNTISVLLTGFFEIFLESRLDQITIVILLIELPSLLT